MSTTTRITVYSYHCPICGKDIHQSTHAPSECKSCHLSGCHDCVNRYHYCVKCWGQISPERQEEIKKEYWKGVLKHILGISAFCILFIVSILFGVEYPDEDISIPVMVVGLVVSFILFVLWFLKMKFGSLKNVKFWDVKIRKGEPTKADKKKLKTGLAVLVIMIVVIVVTAILSWNYYQSMI